MKITENKEYNFLEIHADEGMVMTDWDKADIKEYSSTTLMCTPMGFDYSKYYEITKEEDEDLKLRQREAYEKEEQARRN